MSQSATDAVPKSEVGESSRQLSAKLTPVEYSLLEYVLFVHGSHIQNRSGLISLLLHAQLLSRGARPTTSQGRQFAVLDSSTFRDDPIRLSYMLVPRPRAEIFASLTSQLQLSLVETDSQILITLTDTTTDKFGHLELSCVEHVRIPTEDGQHSTGDLDYIYPHLDEILDLFEVHLWKPVLPSPPQNRTTESERKRDPSNPPMPPDEPPQHYPPAGYDPGRTEPEGFPFPDYGRSDLDPLGSLAGRGGMILDPRRHPPSNNPFGPGSFMGGPDVLPPGSVPPGARFDPFGPGVMPPRPRFGQHPGNRRHPDPDHALPPGYDDMYL